MCGGWDPRKLDRVEDLCGNSLHNGHVGRDVLVVQFRWLVGISPLTSEGCGLIPCEGSHPFRAADGAHGVEGEVGSWPVSDLEGIFKPPPGDLQWP